MEEWYKTRCNGVRTGGRDGQALTRTNQCWRRCEWEVYSEFSKLNSKIEDWRCGKGQAVVRDGWEYWLTSR